MLRKHGPRWLFVGLLILSYCLALTSAIQKSPTMDEQNHIARGAAYLGTGDPRLSIEHPPLVNVLSASPAHLLLDLHLPLDQWWEAGEWYHFADNFLWHANQHPDRIVFLARLPIIGLGLMLAALVFRWAEERFGPWGGLLAAAFCALDPNVLAHERLSTTDIGGTFFAFLTAYAFWKALRQPSLSRLLGSGLSLGLAFAAKLSTLLFGPILALVVLLDGITGRRQSRIRRPCGEPFDKLRAGSFDKLRAGSFDYAQDRLVEPACGELVEPACGELVEPVLHRVGFMLLAALVALLVVWASYHFQVGPLEEKGLPVPASPYVRGIQAVLELAGGERPGYLLGQVSTEGWWYYFPVAFAVKTPLATLVGLLIATMAMLRRPSRDDLFIFIPPLVYFLVVTTARLNLGYRHLLPILPFLALHIARLALPTSCLLPPASCFLLPASRIAHYLPIILIIALAFSTLSIYPHFLAYFNPLGGGPKNGWRILADSNIDWGQDLKGLQTWMEQEKVERVRLSWFGSAYPEQYGIVYDPLPGVGFPSHFELWSYPPFNTENPEPGIYVISVSNLVGVALPDPDLYAWFRARPPDERIGYSLFIYRVTGP